jgi:putative RNA 2'-phosphotransferase
MDSLEKLSRLVSYALRHQPWLYELELDEEGWVSVDALLEALHDLGPLWDRVGQDDLRQMVERSAKRRYEIVGDRIRALYGHSIPGKILRIQAVPPEQLFHGTSPQAWAVIIDEGLWPMGRQYVHLSVDVATACQVGRRKSLTPVVLTVWSRQANDAGVCFWRGNELVWLADHIPAAFIAVADEPSLT